MVGKALVCLQVAASRPRASACDEAVTIRNPDLSRSRMHSREIGIRLVM